MQNNAYSCGDYVCMYSYICARLVSNECKPDTRRNDFKHTTFLYKNIHIFRKELYNFFTQLEIKQCSKKKMCN